MSTTPIVYLSFDRFPSPKGAATHIDAFVRALGNRFGNVTLLTIPSEAVELARRAADPPRYPIRLTRRWTVDGSSAPDWSATGVTHRTFDAPGQQFFERVLSFRSQIWMWWQRQFGEGLKTLPIVHFRSIFEGYPIARHKPRFCRQLVFEVNGLPSIELKYRYPRCAEDRELSRKLKAQEQVCLDAADLILTVSQVNAEHLRRRGVAADRIRVIPNGVDADLFAYRSPSLDGANSALPLRMLYSGTLSSWQGVGLAIEALALYRRDFPATLTLVGHARPHQKRDLIQHAWDLGVHESVQLLDPVSRSALAALHHQADVIVAPLTRNDRNLVQGCCPLKVLEAMASGTPLIASDLPVVRELAIDDREALLVRPGSAKAIKDGMLRLARENGLARRLSEAARQRVEQNFTWTRAQQALTTAYDDLLVGSSALDNLANSAVSRVASTSD